MPRFGLAAASAAVLILGGSSIAVAGPPAHNWTGVYFGIGGGYGWGSTSVSPDVAPIPFGGNTLSPAGGFASLGLTVNKQINNTVFGIMADVSMPSIKKSGNWFEDDFPETDPWNVQTSLFATLRARVGHAFGTFLPYVSAGLALQQSDVAWTYEGTTQHFQPDSLGLAVGGGVEVALPDNWSFGAEYIYMNFGDYKNSTITFSDEGNTGGKISSIRQVIKFSLNYKFGG